MRELHSGIWGRSGEGNIPIKLKVNIYKASVVSVFLYGCERRIIGSAIGDKINSFATSCFRIMLDIRCLDKVTNEDIYPPPKKKKCSSSSQYNNVNSTGWAKH